MKTENKKKGFYIGRTKDTVENDYKAVISRLKDKMDNESIIIEFVRENGSKWAKIEGNAHYPLQLLLNAHNLCEENNARAFVNDVKMNFVLDSWYNYLKDTDERVKIADNKSYEELLQSLWGDYVSHSSLDFTTEVVYL